MNISVIIPYFNSSDSITRSLESIKNQTYLPKEVIIVDDFSNRSHSLTFLEKEKGTYPFELILIYHKKNLGAPSARNTGIQSAKFEYIAFLDADDCWVKEKLEIQKNAITNYDLLYANYSESKAQINSRKSRGNSEIKTISYFDILKKNLSPVTLLVKRSSIILFDKRFRRCDDFKMSIEALASGCKIGYINIDVAYGFKRTIGGGGLTKSLSKMSYSYLKACLIIIKEHSELFFIILPFILYELLKFPIRCIKVYFSS